MSGLLASGGDAYVLYSGNHVNAGLYWNASFFVVCFITTIHVPLLLKHERYAWFGYLCMKGMFSARKKVQRGYHTHTHTLRRNCSEGPGRVYHPSISQRGPPFTACCYAIQDSAIAAYGSLLLLRHLICLGSRCYGEVD